MNLKVLASSSKGNCYILESSGKKLLLECGINVKDIKRGLGFDFRNVVGCLVTHEHLDHSKSAKDLLDLGVNVYTSAGTAVMRELEYHRLNIVKARETYQIGHFTVIPFDVQHDAAEALGYLILDTKTGEKLLFATDTFYLKYQFEGLNYILVECNYIKDILEENIDKGWVPKSMSNRLLRSHFSLENVKEFLKANDMSTVRKIVLLHLSDGNSDAKRMVSEIEELTKVETVVADKNIEIELEMFPF